MKTTLTATLPNIGEISRTTETNYTHVVFCPAYVAGEGAERISYAAQISWASSLELAEKAACSMGYARTFKHWSGGRRVYERSKIRAVEPVIVPVNAK